MIIPFEIYSAFLFDLDGTLADSMKLHNQAWIKTYKDLGLVMTNEILQEYAGVPSVKTVQILNDRFNWNLLPEHIAGIKERTFLTSLDQISVVQPVYKIVEKLKDKPMAIVSGGTRDNVEKTLSILKVRHHFEVVVCAEDTKRGKPSPDPFLKAAELLKINPKDCLVFEDGEAGILSAQACGMGVVKVNSKQELIYL
jgi:HAD superfamily hydrolase (TIGR01509 family)